MSAQPQRQRVSAPFANAPSYVIAVALSLVVIVPIAYVVISGFRTTGQIAADSVAWPHPWHFNNYTHILTTGTLNCPASAAAHDPSVISTPLTATRVSVALENVCARTPVGLFVDA